MLGGFSRIDDITRSQDGLRKHGVQVLVNFDLAFYPTTHAAKAKADSGEIGLVWRLHGVLGHGGPSARNTPQNLFFLKWLTDPVENGGGALVDFGCYAAVLASWYKGSPQSVYATSHRLKPETYPKVEDNAAVVLTYRDGVALLEASWNLPRGFQELEVFGQSGSIHTFGSERVTLRKGREPEVRVDVPALPPHMAGPTQYVAYCLRNSKQVEGLVSLDLNVRVMEILEAAKMSVQSGRAVVLPLPK